MSSVFEKPFKRRSKQQQQQQQMWGKNECEMAHHSLGQTKTENICGDKFMNV